MTPLLLLVCMVNNCQSRLLETSWIGENAHLSLSWVAMHSCLTQKSVQWLEHMAVEVVCQSMS